MLAGDRTEAAARRLAHASAAERDAQNRLGMLEQLQDEYSGRMNDQLVRGTSVHGWQNFNQFMRKVGVAVDGQARLTGDAQLRQQQAQQAWQQERQRQLSYEALAKRAALRQLKIEQKRDQKAMDEFAANAARCKASFG